MAYNEQDFDSFFSAFNSNSSGGSIKQLYDIMPSLTAQEIKVISDGLFFCERYQLDDVKLFLENIVSNKKRNRSLGMMPSFKSFLKYMTLDEKVKSVKVSANSDDS